MSYILDALRRADAERQRGQVPGLGAQPAAMAADTDAPRRLPGWTIAAGILAVAAGLVALVMWRTQPGAPPAAPVSAALPAPAAPPRASVPPALPVVVSAPQPAPLSQPAAAAATTPGPPLVAQRPLPAPAATPTAAASRPEVAATPLAALSADQRRVLPPLVVGGSIWSDSAAQRFVIINGQLVHEGEAVASGVVVERITPRSAILRWRELRIELPL